MDSKRTLLNIFHVSESYKLPDAIMDALLSDNAESIIRLVKKSTHDDIRDIFEPEPLPDMETLLKELQKIENEERKTRKELYKMLGELVSSKRDMNVIKEHRKLLNPQNTRNTFRQMTLEDYENAM